MSDNLNRQFFSSFCFFGVLVMKILLSWLSDYVEVSESAEKIAQILSDLGLGCEGIEHLGDDSVIDFEVTSNRGDCLSYIGVARELAAATGKQLKLPAIELAESQKSASELVGVEIEDADLCGRYTARIIEGVKVGTSPDWMRKRLEAVGMRSVSNVVDATNYAMLETGQPPHAFDYKKIKEGKIIVRRAKAGETIVSIDGTKCELTDDMLVIADAKEPVGVAGVMGGLYTEVGADTDTILLEDAYFNPVTIRNTSRRLNLPSEAAFRFERIVDIENIDWASKRTAQLIVQAAGGKVAKGLVDVYPKKPERKKVSLRPDRINKLLGIEVATDDMIRILSALSFNPEIKADFIECGVPSWRADIYREADLIEEVARVYGYNKIPTEEKINIVVTPVDKRQKLGQVVGKYLNGCGYYETISVTFVADNIAELFSASREDEQLAVRDEFRKSVNLLRQNLIGSLLGVVKTNLNFKNTPCRVFEIADTFVPRGKVGLPIEKTRLALACDGEFRELKGVIDGLIKALNRNAEIVFTNADLTWAQAATLISVNGKTIGTAGVVSDKVKDKFDFTDVQVCAAEMDLIELEALQTEAVKFAPIPRFPAVERDLSVVINEQVIWADIAGAIEKTAPTELEEVRFVGVYRGKSIPGRKKSVTFTLRFRDEQGTLTHEAVDVFQKDIVMELKKAIGAELRAV